MEERRLSYTVCAYTVYVLYGESALKESLLHLWSGERCPRELHLGSGLSSDLVTYQAPFREHPKGTLLSWRVARAAGRPYTRL